MKGRKKDTTTGNTFLLFSVLLGVLVVDQVLKFIVRNGPIPYTLNSGSIWGIFQGSSSILIWITLFVIGAFFYKFEIITAHKVVALGSGLVLGGALGNLVDRIVFGAVIDFIDLGWWPSFNVADAGISIGIVLLIFYFMKE